uniref:AlNc14C1G208 protein n=1 Tax=Albugo laibachii Nc14 TaxID=890382 RepID=F0VZ68_9STRA|nr:AlNc14C1G208 [Albugo laibachii Nc14]|eukprot:CCA14083.1 AlNc14C1G208 [Albugo laibachii Nc14]
MPSHFQVAVFLPHWAHLHGCVLIAYNRGMLTTWSNCQSEVLSLTCEMSLILLRWTILGADKR